jgi:peptidoglycan/LPS O-acetylase OafA/YrhL
VRSSSGEHYVALDHIRALAMFLVFSWHFLGRDRLNIHPALFPLGLIDQGHVGVALFMTLSGYLFAKLLDGKDINYLAFLRARFMRLDFELRSLAGHRLRLATCPRPSVPSVAELGLVDHS